jgi:hypothetical protein
MRLALRSGAELLFKKKLLFSPQVGCSQRGKKTLAPILEADKEFVKRTVVLSEGAKNADLRATAR